MPNQLRFPEVERWLDQGVSLFNAGRVAKSVACFTRAIAVSPEDPRGYYFRALANTAAGRSREAEKDVQSMTRLTPRSIKVRLRASEVLRELRLTRKARAVIDLSGRTAEPESGADVWLAKAQLEWSLGSAPAARRCVGKALTHRAFTVGERVRAAQLLEEMGDYTWAERALEACLTVRFDETDSARIEAARRLARLKIWRGDRRSARILAGRLLRANPRDPSAFRIRGAAAALSGELIEARRDFNRAIELARGDVEVLVWRAEVRRRLGNAAGSRSDLAAAGRIAPDHLAAVLNLELLNLASGGRTPERMREYAFSRVPVEVSPLKAAFAEGPGAAEAALQRALRGLGGNRSPSPTFLRESGAGTRLVDHIRFFPRDRLVNLQAALRFGQPRRVLQSFAELVRSTPREAYIYSHRGEVFLWLGRYAAARRDFLLATKLNAGLLWPKVGLGAVWLFEGRLERALEQFEYASKHGGSESIVSPWRGEALRRMRRFEEAREQFDKLKEPMPFRPSVWISRALLCRDLGDEAGMRRIYDRLRSFAPEFFEDVGRAGRPVKALERALEMMRGNRSRWMYTYVVPGGSFKVIRFRGVDPSTIPPGQRGNRWQFDAA